MESVEAPHSADDRAEDRLLSFTIRSNPLACLAAAFCVAVALHTIVDPTLVAELVIMVLAFAFAGRSSIAVLAGRGSIVSALRFSLVATTVTVLLFVGVHVAIGAMVGIGPRELLEHLTMRHLGFVFVALIAPIAETLVSQGWVQTIVHAFSRRAAIPVTMLAFIIPHGYLNPSLLVAAYLLALIRSRTKSLLAVAAAHSTLNMLMFAAEHLR